MNSNETAQDTVIIGGGLTGLFLCHRLHLAGHKVTLLEARDALGGRYRRAGNVHPYGSPDLEFIAATAENIRILDGLKNQAPVATQYLAKDHAPQIFEEGRFRPFAGFGATDFQSVDVLSALFSHTQSLMVQPGLDQLVRALVEQLPVAAQTMSEVTGFKMVDGQIQEVIVNGSKSIKADLVLSTCHPTTLNKLIEGEALAAKHRTRLAKMQSWTAVTLELEHSPALVDDDSIRLFSHSAKEFEPVVGRVFGGRSKWMTLVPGEREADHEFAGQCIRHIKRQLKRAWPSALEGDAFSGEKIYIQPEAYGQHSLKTKDPYRFPEISNLYVAHHALSPVPGELAPLEIVRALDAELVGALNRLPELGASC